MKYAATSAFTSPILTIPVAFQVLGVLAALAHPNHIVHLCSWGFASLPPTQNLKSFGYTQVWTATVENASTRHRISSRMLLLIFLLCLLASPLSLADNLTDTALPDIGNRESMLIDPVSEKALGQQWLRTLRGSTPVMEDPLLNDYVKHLVYSLVPHSDLAHTELSIVVIDSQNINAFAVPGGVMGLNTGLLSAAHHEDEVASVIAHELAHLSQQHFLRRLASMKRAQALNIAGMIGALGLALAGAPPNASMAAIATSQAATIDSILRHSRSHEEEADRIGMATLLRSKRNPHAMPAFFQTLHDKYRFTSRPPEFLLTHPVTEKRISDAKNRLQSMNLADRYTDNPSSLWFELTKVRLEANSSRNPVGMANVLAQQLTLERSPGRQEILRYAIACGWLASSEPKKALPYLESLLAGRPSDLVFQYTLAEGYLLSDNIEKALRTVEAALDVNPDNLALTTLGARIYLRAQQPERALKLLEPLARQNMELTPGVWRYLAEAAGKTGKTVDTHRYNAEYFFTTGNYDSALQQLSLALPLANNPQIEAKIKTRQHEIKQAMEPVDF